MYAFGSFIAFVIVVFHTVKYYHANKDKSSFDMPDFGLGATVIVLIATFLSWAAVIGYFIVTAVNYYYTKYILKEK